MSLKNVVRIAISPDAKTAVHAFAEKNAMTEIGVMSRVYLWFVAQDDVVRKSIVGVLPGGYEADVAEIALKRLATRKKK
jgi:hypothetical protein